MDDCEDVMVSEINQLQKGKYCLTSQYVEHGVTSVLRLNDCCQGQGGKSGVELLLNRHTISDFQDKKIVAQP